MTGISKSSPLRKNDGFHRYLKPGALAQIRNSRINNNARSNSLVIRSFLDLVDNTPPSEDLPLLPTMDQMPDLLSKIYGPCRIGRKKYGPARSVLKTMMNLNPRIEAVSGNNNHDVVIGY